MLTVLAAAAIALAAEPPVLGLLALPEVFGYGECDSFTPAEIPLHAAAGSNRTVGTIRVARYWTFHEGGGCEGLQVGVYMDGRDEAEELPVREYTYGAPAAIVTGREGRWFRVRLASGAAWIRPSDSADYHPLEELLEDALTYFTEEWDGELFAAPAGARQAERDAPLPTGGVRVTGFRRQGGRLWASVEVLSHSPCDAPDEPRIIRRGWLPLHSGTGESVIWFFSRGC